MRCWPSPGGSTRTLGGPPVKDINEPATTRRAIYGYIDRLNLPGVFRTFDFPNPDATSPERVPDHRAAAGAVLHEQPARDRSRPSTCWPVPTWRRCSRSDGENRPVVSLDSAAAIRRPRRSTGPQSFVDDAPRRAKPPGINCPKDCCLTNEFVFID